MKLGLDFDGVINKMPWLFGPLTHLLVEHGHEVHVLTGNRGTPEFIEDLRGFYGIKFTHFYSIADHHRAIGTPMTGYEENNTWIAEDVWDRSKGEYCDRYNIDMHIDDSPVYGKYFKKTRYILFRWNNAA